MRMAAPGTDGKQPATAHTTAPANGRRDGRVNAARAARLVVSTMLMGLVAVQAAAQARFDDVVRNLRNPDAKERLNAVKLLREAKYPEAIVPMAPLVNDPLDPIQLEAIAAELSFFLVQDVPERKRVALIVEVRNRGGAEAAFQLGPMAVWPRPAPPELILALLKAVDDENARVRLEAIYAAATIGKAPLEPEAEQLLVKALDHYDPQVRAGAALFAGRAGVKAAADGLIKAINDSNAEVRYAAMRALGQLREERAVVALTEQLKFYGKGEGAWSALDALAHIAHPSSVPLFVERIADRDANLRRAAAEGLGRSGDTSQTSALETAAGNDSSDAARAAMAFALQKLGRNYVPRLSEFLDDNRTALQVQAYFLELGPSIEKELLPSLQEPDPSLRAAIADVLGAIGGDASLAALQNLQQDRDKVVVDAARRGVERIRMRRATPLRVP
jgi:HEAT repeat protein